MIVLNHVEPKKWKEHELPFFASGCYWSADGQRHHTTACGITDHPTCLLLSLHTYCCTLHTTELAQFFSGFKQQWCFLCQAASLDMNSKPMPGKDTWMSNTKLWEMYEMLQCWLWISDCEPLFDDFDVMRAHLISTCFNMFQVNATPITPISSYFLIHRWAAQSHALRWWLTCVSLAPCVTGDGSTG